jgi:hypothetical protein
MMITDKYIDVSLFNSAGTSMFINILQNRPPDIFKQLENITSDDRYIERLNLKLAWRIPSNRWDLAEILWQSFGDDGDLRGYAGSAQLWNWISAKLFETLHNGDIDYVRQEKKKRQEIEQWVLLETSRSYHRHRVSGPFFAYRNNYPRVQAALSQLTGPVLELSEVAERIAGKRELSYGAVAELSTLLYVDPKSGQIRKKITDKPGEAQQLSTFFKQLDLTVDYESMSVKELLDFLPANFSELVRKVKNENQDLR